MKKRPLGSTGESLSVVGLGAIGLEFAERAAAFGMAVHAIRRSGRSEEAQFSFEDRWLSRQHCEIDCFDGQLIVRDLRSRHGTYVNDMKIDESPLNINDQLRIGLTRFIVKSTI